MDTAVHRVVTARSQVTRLLAVLALVLPALLLPSSAQAATPHCGIYWGSLAKSSSATVPRGVPTGDVTNVRTGRHACYDRLVIDVDGASHGFSVRYVDKVRGDASGLVIPTAGGARLQIVAKAPAYDDDGNPTFLPNRARVSDVTGYRTFRQVTWADTFEGQTSLGLGVRARLPFRVFTLAGPGSGSRIVVDVAHRW
ncbi:AMIN-like domain-containing (lipo)protein [Aquipuribacter nitratireducens]|uniref:AMIN-like domain-containing protein n=1 Tax=Aquipuribacter nitratireducens TaxID=650104 RepID=A0ABW0GHQ5_9MICO